MPAELAVPDSVLIELWSLLRFTRALVAVIVLVWRPHPAGAQDSLSARPAVRATAVYDGAAVADLSGGVRRGTTYLGVLSIDLAWDGRQLAGWSGSSIYVNALQTHGGNPSSLVGDAQGVSNLAAPSGLRLEEAWFQQNLFRNRLSVLVGRYDLNTEFYTLQSASLFLNSSFGIGPEFSQSGREGPSIFPFTAVGTRVVFKPSRNVVLRTAVLDGVPVDRPNGGIHIFAPGDGLLLVGEAAFLSRPTGEAGPHNHRFRIGRGRQHLPYEGKIAIGAWHYTASFDDLSVMLPSGQPVRHSGSGGLYAVAEQTVWTQRSNSARALTLFGQLGTGDPL